jgi:hypothetical protein
MLQPPPPMPMQATQPSVTHQTVTIINGATAAAAAGEQAQDRQPDPDAAWPAFLTVPEDQLPLIADHIHRQSTAAGDDSLTKEQSSTRSWPPGNSGGANWPTFAAGGGAASAHSCDP